MARPARRAAIEAGSDARSESFLGLLRDFWAYAGI
jgi:hypothetical protein